MFDGLPPTLIVDEAVYNAAAAGKPATLLRLKQRKTTTCLMNAGLVDDKGNIKNGEAVMRIRNRNRAMLVVVTVSEERKSLYELPARKCWAIQILREEK